ncbi:uncharacterized protein LAESUDRAFT_690248 [Laetiporus sulphureus 93-53]|uniref:DUF676 domain-containing protein n=1 Tax=Laetiporus sulphureus 93-53 TaxID=1314785 RepID=A0A165IHN3_9APHY|nr:uncharacterized protein LAESUDRAFT_690248 [Laetiporus sulphureus 93-53]KZT13086.1 hypothetical protein LAESUDRAFT_690248 [Laetiporus sulphureus 93-53]
MASASSLPSDLVLVVFIHGFKGSENTFARFPERLQHILTETIHDAVVECVVFPAYEVSLAEAVVRFADWLTNLAVQRENGSGLGGGAGKAKIVLCGHSMGGLLAADTLIEFVRTRPDPLAPLWPNIVACISFDTPYLGLNPAVFKNGVTQAASYVRDAFTTLRSFTSSNPPSATASRAAITAAPNVAASTSMWQKWAPGSYAVGGALLAGAALGAAYYKREELDWGYKWATDHMKYVRALLDENSLQRRLQRLVEIEEEMGVVFRAFYTFVPPKPPSSPSPRTFIVLPKKPAQLVEHFVQATNSLAADEVSAHTGMFDVKANDGYYALGLTTAQFIREAVVCSRKTASESQELVHPAADSAVHVPAEQTEEQLLLD